MNSVETATEIETILKLSAGNDDTRFLDTTFSEDVVLKKVIPPNEGKPTEIPFEKKAPVIAELKNCQYRLQKTGICVKNDRCGTYRGIASFYGQRTQHEIVVSFDCSPDTGKFREITTIMIIFKE